MKLIVVLSLIITIRAAAGAAEYPDVSIRYIQRLPEIDYIWGSEQPEDEGWPSSGETVTWRAHIKNWSDNSYPELYYQWMVDDIEVEYAAIVLQPKDEITVNLEWTWAFDRHEISLIIKENEQSQEILDELTIYSNALSVGLYAEESFYDSLDNAWEQWVQYEINRWNIMLENAIFEETPEGVNDRFRIDQLTIVGDGDISNPNIPNENDRTVDIQWGFPVNLIDFVQDAISDGGHNNSFVHELGHARYLIDVYAFSVSSFDSVMIKEGNEYITGTELMPNLYKMNFGGVIGYSYFETEMTGLMNSQWGYMDRYSSAAMNLMTGWRAIRGNYNGSSMEGFFMNDLPVQNQLVIKDSLGNVLPNANVKIYQSVPLPMNVTIYRKYFDNQADIEVYTDSEGKAVIGGIPFGNEITHNPLSGSNSVIIIRAEHNGLVGYEFLESGYFNLQYWSGNTWLGEYELEFTMKDPLTAVHDDNQDIIPSEFELYQNYPNPFNPVTTIKYSIPSKMERGGLTPVKLTVYDILGRKVKTIVNEYHSPGRYEATFDGSNLASGIYIYRLKAGGFVASKKMILAK